VPDSAPLTTFQVVSIPSGRKRPNVSRRLLGGSPSEANLSIPVAVATGLLGGARAPLSVGGRDYWRQKFTQSSAVK